MNLWVLYLLLLKATITSFNGPMSLPIVRDEFVVNRRVLTDRQLNAAVTAGRSAPGPMGTYVVSVGYFAAGVPGAIAGFLALITPSFLVIFLVRFAGNRVDSPRFKRTLDALVVASAGLVLHSGLPLAHDAITGVWPRAFAIGSFVLLTWKRIETIWLIAGCAAISVIVHRAWQ